MRVVNGQIAGVDGRSVARVELHELRRQLIVVGICESPVKLITFGEPVVDASRELMNVARELVRSDKVGKGRAVRRRIELPVTAPPLRNAVLGYDVVRKRSAAERISDRRQAGEVALEVFRARH